MVRVGVTKRLEMVFYLGIGVIGGSTSVPNGLGVRGDGVSKGK